jgi:hypothetical protein
MTSGEIFKGKVVLSLICKRIGALVVQHYSFLTLALDGGQLRSLVNLSPGKNPSPN